MNKTLGCGCLVIFRRRFPVSSNSLWSQENQAFGDPVYQPRASPPCSLHHRSLEHRCSPLSYRQLDRLITNHLEKRKRQTARHRQIPWPEHRAGIRHTRPSCHTKPGPAPSHHQGPWHKGHRAVATMPSQFRHSVCYNYFCLLFHVSIIASTPFFFNFVSNGT